MKAKNEKPIVYGKSAKDCANLKRKYGRRVVVKMKGEMFER